MAKEIFSKKELEEMETKLRVAIKKVQDNIFRYFRFLENNPEKSSPKFILIDSLDMARYIIIHIEEIEEENKKIILIEKEHKGKKRICYKDHSVSFKEIDFNPYYEIFNYIFLLKINCKVPNIKIEKSLHCNYENNKFIIVPFIEEENNNIILSIKKRMLSINIPPVVSI